MKEGYFRIMLSLLKYLAILLSTSFLHGRMRHQITHRMMYRFAIIGVQCGPWKEKTEIAVVRVGSNLKRATDSASKFDNDKKRLLADSDKGSWYDKQIYQKEILRNPLVWKLMRKVMTMSKLKI